MVHGACSSAGCYAMTDRGVGEIYAIVQRALAAGQKHFQVQAYPFRMTTENMALHKGDPSMAFWKTLKQGYDAFAFSRRQPKVFGFAEVDTSSTPNLRAANRATRSRHVLPPCLRLIPSSWPGSRPKATGLRPLLPLPEPLRFSPMSTAACIRPSARCWKKLDPTGSPRQSLQPSIPSAGRKRRSRIHMRDRQTENEDSF